MSEFRREVTADPAYDHLLFPCSPECAARGPRSHGRHGVTLRFLLHGELGTTQFVIHTGWELGWVKQTDWGKAVDADTPLPTMTGKRPILHAPMASDLGYHWRTEPYEGCYSPERCDVLGGEQCWYDGSGLNAEPVFARLIEEGSDGVWAELEAYYRSLAGERVA